MTVARHFGQLVLAIAVAAAAVIALPGTLGPTPAKHPTPVAIAGGVTPVGQVNAAIGGGNPPPPDTGSTDAGAPLGVSNLPGMDRPTRGLRLVAPARLLAGYQWPLPKGILTLPFGPSPWGSRVVNGELFHDGIDLATVCGDRIVAGHEGIVLAAGRKFDEVMGWIGDLTPYLERLDAEDLWRTLPIVIVIDDGNGYRSIYAHFSSVTVKKGQRVKAGQLIGYEGASGRASGCHLHYGLFSPYETATFAIDPGVVTRLKVPPKQIARIDPLLVLPPRPQDAPTPEATAAPVAPPVDEDADDAVE